MDYFFESYIWICLLLFVCKIYFIIEIDETEANAVSVYASKELTRGRFTRERVTWMQFNSIILLFK